MNNREAMQALIDGHKITVADWMNSLANRGFYFQLSADGNAIVDEDGDTACGLEFESGDEWILWTPPAPRQPENDFEDDERSEPGEKVVYEAAATIERLRNSGMIRVPPEFIGKLVRVQLIVEDLDAEEGSDDDNDSDDSGDDDE